MPATVWGALLPGVPFLLAVAGLLLPHRARTAAATLAVGGAAIVLLIAIGLAIGVHQPVDQGVRVVDFGSIAVTFGVRLDGVATMVAIAVGVVALAVQVYSVAYLRDDDRYVPYAAQVSLFTAAMLLVVVSGDLIALLIGWEVMGICSYLLIGHDRRLPEAPRAAVKAFLVTRVGDVGFLLGVGLLGLRAGSFRIGDVFARIDDLPRGTLTVACLLLLAGVAGKSAQFPLHTWLPDAMAGPTPISALIHAATMEAAGVSAAITMLLGALAATAQDDIKRVLAWSTVSQLCYMSGALAVGAPAAALFHLLTHAAFKALLFLAAGAVIHAVGTNIMAAMGGLRRGMPATFWSMTIGLAALAGVPPLAGIWSKDGIVEATLAGEGPAPAWLGSLVFLAAIATIAVTAWYAMRLWLYTFFGAPRGPEAEHPHEPPWAMRGPVVALAVPSALLGFAAFWPGLGDRLGGDLLHFNAEALIPLAALALGAGLAYVVWRREPQADPALALGPARQVFANAFYVDNVQEALVVRPAVRLAAAVRRGDESLVDGAMESTGRGATGLGSVLAQAHRAALPRAATAVLAGAVVLGLIAAVWR